MKKLVHTILLIASLVLYNCKPVEKDRKEIIIELEDSSLEPQQIVKKLNKRLEVHNAKIISFESLSKNELKLICSFYSNVSQPNFSRQFKTPGKISFHKGITSIQSLQLQEQLNNLILDKIQKDSLSTKEQLIASVFSKNSKGLVNGYIGNYQSSARPRIESFLKTKSIDSLFSSYLPDYTYTFNDNKVNNSISLYLYDKKSYLTGEYIEEVNHTLDQLGRNSINIQFNKIGEKKFEKLSKQATVQRYMIPIVYDQQVLLSPMVAAPIKSGSIEIAGDFTADEVKEKVAILKSGELPTIRIKSIKNPGNLE